VSWLNADIPPFFCLLRSEFLYDLRSHHGQFTPVWVFGIASVQGRAIGFHCLTEGGAQVARVPIHALCWKRDAPARRLDDLELWDCFSYRVSVHAFDVLKGMRARAILKDRSIAPGDYLFTVDWFGSPASEEPGDGGFKNAHVIRLDEGNFAALPNNRILWHEASFITKPLQLGAMPGYLTNTHVWRAEGPGKWRTEDSDAFFYGIVDDT
jgi:hypothetical protein